MEQQLTWQSAAVVASPLATRLDGEGRQYVSGNLIIDLLCSADKIVPRKNVNKNQQEEEDRAAGSGVTWQ